MRDLVDHLIRPVERLVVALAMFGALLIFVQMVWISYGVFMRYVMDAPDRMVTEATALLLFPVALLGLAYAMREDSNPRVTLLIERLTPRSRKFFEVVNGAIMFAIGVFLSITTVKATISAFNSGASTEILRWPRYLLWSPVSFAICLFTLYALLRLLQLVLRPASEME